MKKILLILVCISIIFGGIFLFNKKNNDDFYKDIEEEQDKDVSENVVVNDISEEEIIEEAQSEKIEISIDDIEKTKKIGLKFVPLVHSYDLENGHEESVRKATEYSTEGMKSLLIGAFIETKQPILFENFFARKVKDVRAIEPYIEDTSITWKYDVYSDILNRDGEVINQENNRVMLMFVKENGEWRVGDYATTQYR